MSKILIIEDEVSFSEALSFLLEKEGFETSVAETGKAGIEAFNKEAFDLVLLDLMIPEISGIDVCPARFNDSRNFRNRCLSHHSYKFTDSNHHVDR